MSDQKTLMREMLANAVHFGHKTSKWNPKMAPYLYGQRNGVHVFDLNQTYDRLKKAEDFLTAAVQNGKRILLVSTKQQSMLMLRDMAEKCDVPYVNSKWIPGLLTNFRTLKTRIKYMLKLKEDQTSGAFEKYTKKEAGRFRKEIVKLDTALGGVQNLEKVPDVVVVFDVVRDHIAVKEAKNIGATVVGVLDSNADPAGVQYPIPANDDAIKSITFLMGRLEAAIMAGKKGKK